MLVEVHKTLDGYIYCRLHVTNRYGTIHSCSCWKNARNSRKYRCKHGPLTIWNRPQMQKHRLLFTFEKGSNPTSQDINITYLYAYLHNVAKRLHKCKTIKNFIVEITKILSEKDLNFHDNML